MFYIFKYFFRKVIKTHPKYLFYDFYLKYLLLKTKISIFFLVKIIKIK